MTTNFSPIRYFQITMAVLLLAFMVFCATTPSSASNSNATADNATRRADMLAIAERYLNYTWTATTANYLHGNNIDTPDLNWCNDPWGCWSVAPVVNVGVPYFWGGSTAVEDNPNDSIPDLNLVPQDYFYPAGGSPSVGYFGEKIAAGVPAGDVGTADAISWGLANGVDCVGFVGQVWRQGSRYGMSKTSTYSRPIKFKDLRAGDVVLRYVSDGYDHVVLFKEFLNYDPLYGNEPVAGVNGTRFLVYEAALGPHKVVISEYQLIELLPEQQTFNGAQNTDRVKIKRIKYCDPNSCKDDGVYELGDFYPRTYFTPIDIVLVIDTSGSMSGQKLIDAQYAAMSLVDYMRPGDKIGVVAFNSVPSLVIPSQEILTETGDLAKNEAKLAIFNLMANGGTSIGGGLQVGLQELTKPAIANDPVRLMVLMSDGIEGNGKCSFCC